MMHLGLTPVPQFASLTCSLDVSTQDDDLKTVLLQPMAELLTVISPFAALSSHFAQEMLIQLHGHIKEKAFSDSIRDMTALNNIDHLNTSPKLRRSKFQEKYEKCNQRQTCSDTPIRTFTPTTLEGYFFVYAEIQEPTSVQRLTAIFLQGSMQSSLFSSCIQPTKKKPLISSWVLSICFTSGVSFGSLPNNLYIQTYLSRFIECHHELLQLPANMGTVSPQDQFIYLQAMLMSILMDDEYIKTKESELLEYNPDSIMSKAMVDGSGFKSTKGGISVRRLPNLVFKRDKSKVSTVDGDVPIQSTALISTSATSSEISKIVADQYQVLSLVEKKVNLKGYHRKSNAKNTIKSDSTAKTQIKALQKAGIRKIIGDTKDDLAGFEFMEPYNIPVHIDDDDDDDMTIESTISSDFSTLSITSSMSRDSSTTKSSGSFKVPTLQGSSRDSSSMASNQRKNRLVSVAASSNQTKMMVGRLNGEGSALTRSPSPSPRLHASPKDPLIKSVRGGPSSTIDSSNFNPFSFSPDGKNVDDNSFDKNAFSTNHPTERNSQRTEVQAEERSQIPTKNDEVIVTLAINEDLSCNFRNSSLIALSIQGVVQIQAAYPSDYKSPLIVTLRDPLGHIQTIDRMSAGVKTNSVVDGEYRYNVALPQYKEYVPILKYRCSMKLKPDPLRVQVRSRVQGSKCQVYVVLSANPKNLKSLINVKVLLALPKYAARSSADKPPVGRWVEGSNSIEWIIGKIDPGETLQLQAQMEFHNVTDDVKGNPEFSLLVQCECLSVQLSDIQVFAQTNNELPLDVTNALAQRFRIFYKEQIGEPRGQRVGVK